ncbi:hypothetical protein ACWDO7_22675 [Streptomyces sp. NPDC003656]|uniref:hypothetical protein n=1 Tax=Streptomyces sp. NPDC091385 TaxID=3365997 RepID=UPI003825DA97
MSQSHVFWPPPAPQPGDLVMYRLDDSDVRAITRQRLGMTERGTPVRAGQQWPAVVVRAEGDSPDVICNLHVFLDGPDTYWAQQARSGDAAGTWMLPSPSEV